MKKEPDNIALGKNNLKIDMRYARDLTKYPLPSDHYLDGKIVKKYDGEVDNRQDGVCNNFNNRKNGGEQTYLVQHYTASDFERSIKWFIGGGVSAHALIDKNGNVYKLVSDEHRAYHAGLGNLIYKSKLNPSIPQDIIKNDMNSHSLGIENVNNGNEAFGQEQILANILLCEDMCDRNKSINPKLMLGHSDWSYRKIDPGPYFPWKYFANAKQNFENSEYTITRNFGIFPNKNKLDLEKDINEKNNDSYNPAQKIIHNGEIVKDYHLQGGELLEKIISIKNMLCEYGYYIDGDAVVDGKISESFQRAILAYNIRFNGQEIIQDEHLLNAWRLLHAEHNIENVQPLCNFTEPDVLCLGDVNEQF